MNDAHLTVIRRSLILWIGTGLLISVMLAAAAIGDISFLLFVLGATAAFAVFGIGFGIWAGQHLARAHRRS